MSCSVLAKERVSRTLLCTTYTITLKMFRLRTQFHTLPRQLASNLRGICSMAEKKFVGSKSLFDEKRILIRLSSISLLLFRPTTPPFLVFGSRHYVLSLTIQKSYRSQVDFERTIPSKNYGTGIRFLGLCSSIF